MKACAAAAALVVLASGAEAFITPASLPSVKSTSACGLKMALEREGMPVNMINPTYFWGEEGYKGYVAGYKEDALVNRAYPVLDRVREKKLLTKTAEVGLLSALEDAGLTLSQAEALLPAIEEAGLLSFAANNADFLLNTAGFLAVEPAELALPVLVSAIRGGPSFFSTLAAGLVVAELGVVVATQNPVLSVVAGLPLLGGAALLSAVAGVLGDLKTGAALRPIKAAAQASSPVSFSGSSSSSSGSSGSTAAATKAGARPKVGLKAEAPKAVSQGRPPRVAKVAGNLSKLPTKRRLSTA